MSSTYADTAAAISRIPVTLVVITLDYCMNVFGTAPCTATGAPCYNTYPTCKDSIHYNRGQKNYKFTSADAPLPFGTGERPYIKSVKYLPTEIKDNFTVSSRVTTDFYDEPDTDVGIDPYLSQRSSVQGTFWKKLLARNTNYKGRRIYHYEGFIGIPESEYQLRNVGNIDNIKTPNGIIRIETVDLLKAFTDVQIPAKFDIKVIGALNDTIATITLTDVTYLDSTGWVRIDDEIISYAALNNSTNQISGCVRGVFGTTASAHNDRSKVQKVRYYAPQNAWDILSDMLLYDGAVDPYIDLVFNMIAAANAYQYIDFASVSDYTIQFGDYFEYDIWLDSAGNPQIGMDMYFSDLTWLSQYGLYDQNGISTYPGTDISAKAYGQWYHRKINISSLAGKIVNNFDISCQYDAGGTMMGRIRNLNITDGGLTIRKVIWNEGDRMPTFAMHVTTDVLQTYSFSVISDYVDLTAFAYWRDWPGENGMLFSAVISEPEKLGTLFFEIVDLLDAKAWVAEDLKITIRRNMPNEPGRSYAIISDDANIIDDSASVDINEKSRYTRILIYWDKTILAKIDEVREYARLDIALDADAEGENGYGDVIEKTFFCRWIRSDYLPQETVATYITHFLERRLFNVRDAQNLIQLDVELKDATLKTGQYIKLSTDELLNPDGTLLNGEIHQIVKRDYQGQRITLNVLRVLPYKFSFIAPGGTPDYDAATDAQHEYGFISDANGRINDKPAYFIY